MQSLKTESSFTFLTIAKGVISGIARELKLLLQQFMEPDQYPITPPPELVQQWREEAAHRQYTFVEVDEHTATQAAQWGADIELEACEALILKMRPHGGRAWTCEQAAVNDALIAVAVELRTARRPKPPSLKEQALALLEPQGSPARLFNEDQMGIIRRALEALPE